LEEDASGTGVERVPAASGSDGRGPGRGVDEASGAGVVGARHFVAEEAQHRGGTKVEVAEAAAEGGGEGGGGGCTGGAAPRRRRCGAGQEAAARRRPMQWRMLREGSSWVN